MNDKKIKSICVTAVFAAVICVLAPFSVSAGPVPISLATFAIYLAAGLLEAKFSLAAVAVYILLGCAGLPVFSAFRGGVQVIAGVTGGYIIGYLPMAVVISLLCSKFRQKKFMYPVSMVIGTALLYAFGTAWFIVQTKTTLAAALASCVTPFLIGDAVKIAAASVICPLVRDKLKNKS